MKVKLEEVCKRIYAGGDVPKDRYSEVKNEQYQIPIYANAEKDEGLYGYTDVARENDLSITVAARGTIGYTAIRKEPFLPVVRLITVVPDTDKISVRYLYYALRNCKPQSSGTSIPQLTVPDIKKNNIYLYEIDEQEKIADILDKAEAIIETRKSELQKLDDLIKARFVEMFGDPVTNPKGWDMPLIEDVVANEKNALKAGPFGSALKKEYYVSSGYKIYGQEQVISGDHTFGDYYIDEERYRMLENCAVQAGDVLISLVGTYGKLLVMPEEFELGIINPRLMKITFDKSRVDPHYFQHYFQSDSLKKALAENTHGGTMDILNLGIVRKLAIPLPPLELQNDFLRFVEQVDKSKVVVQKALEETQILFDSLMQKYFG